MKKSILALGVFVSLLNGSAVFARTENTVKEVCKNVITPADKEQTILFFSINLEGASYSYNVMLDCKKLGLVHTFNNYITNKTTQVAGKYGWDKKTDLMTFEVKNIIGKKNLFIVAKPVVENVSVACSNCNGGKMNLGKKLIFMKDRFSMLDALGYLSDKTPAPAVLTKMKNSVSVYEAEQFYDHLDGKLNETFLHNDGTMVFSAASLVFKKGFQANNETVENTDEFYKAQTTNYSDLFSALASK